MIYQVVEESLTIKRAHINPKPKASINCQTKRDEKTKGKKKWNYLN